MSQILKDERFKNLADSRTYPVRWLLNALEYANGKLSHLCICGYSKKIWYLAAEGDNPAKPFVINSIDIADGECLDGGWCLNMDCKYNHTTPGKYAKSYHLSDEEAKDLINNWDQFIKNIQDINKVLSEYEDHNFLNFQESEIMEGPGPLVEWVSKGQITGH